MNLSSLARPFCPLHAIPLFTRSHRPSRALTNPLCVLKRPSSAPHAPSRHTCVISVPHARLRSRASSHVPHALMSPPFNTSAPLARQSLCGKHHNVLANGIHLHTRIRPWYNADIIPNILACESHTFSHTSTSDLIDLRTTRCSPSSGHFYRVPVLTTPCLVWRRLALKSGCTSLLLITIHARTEWAC
jgi:hypothetical protein